MTTRALKNELILQFLPIIFVSDNDKCLQFRFCLIVDVYNLFQLSTESTSGTNELSYLFFNLLWVFFILWSIAIYDGESN